MRLPRKAVVLCEIATQFIYYIVNLIAFNLLVNNKLITQFIIAFTFVNMSKISRVSETQMNLVR